MTGKRNFNAAMRKRSSRQPTKNKRFSGYLGIRTNGANTVEVTGHPGFVWVRLRNANNEVIQAFNETTSPIYNLPVLVERDLDSPTRYKIVGRDIDVYGSNWGTASPYLAPHSAQHSWNNDDPNIGGDVAWIYQQQFTPLLVMPSGSAGAGNVLIGAGINHYGNIFSYVGSTGTGNLLTYKPTGSTANLLLVYLDHETGNFGVAEGTPIANTITGTYQVVANLPAPPTGTVPLAGIRLVSGTSSIGWRNIYDVRPFFVAQTTVVGGGGGGGAPTDASYVTLGLDGDLSAERVLTAGADVTITDAGANDNVTVAVATGTFSRANHDNHQRYISVYDDSVFKVTGTILSFDENLRVDVTGTVAYISMTGSVGGAATPSTNELPAYENNVFQVTGTAFVFNDNLTVDVTGTFAYIKATGATGTAGADGSPGPPGDNTTLIYDDSVFKVTGTAISFDSNLSVGVTGSIAYVDASGGGGLYPTSTVPVDADFSWVNQSSGTSTQLSNGVYLYDVPVNTNPSYKCRVKTAPTPPYVITVGILPTTTRTNYVSFGIGWRQSSDGKLSTLKHMAHTTYNESILVVTANANATTDTSNYVIVPVLPQSPIWLRIEDDNTNRNSYFSADGENFVRIHSISRTTYLTADQVLFFIDARNASFPAGAKFFHWLEE